MPGTRAVLSCGLGLSPQPSWGGSGPSARARGHSGRSANQNMPGRRGSWAALLAPQTLQVKTLVGFLRNTRPNQSASATLVLWLL